MLFELLHALVRVHWTSTENITNTGNKWKDASMYVIFSKKLSCAEQQANRYRRHQPYELLGLPSASAVLLVAGGPVRSSAQPARFLWRIMSATSRHDSRAATCPTNPEAIGIAAPLACKRPKPSSENLREDHRTYLGKLEIHHWVGP
jgi:hypothetical protein